MPRNISFMLTTPQFIDGSKDVTRRLGWLFLREGDDLMGVEKSQGLGKGGKIKKLGLIRVVSVRRELLLDMIGNEEYGREECRREGFPEKSPEEFVAFFCGSHAKCMPSSLVTRIEFKKL